MHSSRAGVPRAGAKRRAENRANSRVEGKAESCILIETSSISTFGPRESRTAVFSFKHHQAQTSGKGNGERPSADGVIINLNPRAEGKENSRIPIETSLISTLGQRERRRAVFRLKHHLSQPSGGGKGEQLYSD